MNSVPANGRRYFIGGSDARIIMGDDEGALSFAFGERSAARSSRRIFRATSSSSLALSLRS